MPRQTFAVIAIYHNLLMYAECIQKTNTNSELGIIASIRLVSYPSTSTLLHESHYKSNLRKWLQHYVHLNYIIWSLSNSYPFNLGTMQ